MLLPTLQGLVGTFKGYYGPLPLLASRVRFGVLLTCVRSLQWDGMELFVRSRSGDGRGHWTGDAVRTAHVTA